MPMHPTPRLACEQCKRRKLRCNKASPCAACTDAGLECQIVQRARLPRGKSSKARSRNSKLEDRLAKIEELLSLRSRTANESASTRNTESIIAPRLKTATGFDGLKTTHTHNENAASLVGSEFWEALSVEVQGLRETLEDDEDAIALQLENATGSTPELLNTSAILFATSVKHVDTQLMSQNMRKALLEIYRFRVDTVYKILHWPTTLRNIETRHMSSNETPASLPMQALESAIYFLATCSLTDEEGEESGFGDRHQLVQTFQSSAEQLFASSTLLQSPDLVLLQAFVIYLIGLRTCLSGAYTWTLVATAVRAATALRLEDEPVGAYTAFDTQLRRRLLFAIGILDTHTALDRGTVPILPASAFIMPPLNIDDEDMSPPNNVPVCSSPGHTDMSHSAMTYEAMICQRRLYELPGDSQDTREIWTMKLEHVAAFGNYVEITTSDVNDSCNPLRKLQRISGQKILVSLQLLVRRPPYRQHNNIVPPWDDFDVFEAATNVLEHHLQPVPPELKPWAWKNWVQWHALAVILAELLVRPQGTLSDRAYHIAIISFRHYAKIVADSESGMLWKPIAKLMRRVQRLRRDIFATASAAIPFNEPSLHAEHEQLTGTESKPTHDLQMFDTIDWNYDDPNWNTCLNDDFTAQKQDSNGMYDESTPWLSWDSFLQDVTLPDV